MVSASFPPKMAFEPKSDKIAFWRYLFRLAKIAILAPLKLALLVVCRWWNFVCGQLWPQNSDLCLLSFEKMYFRWNWRVPKWRFSGFSHFGEKSSILRKPHLELFLASNRALNAENVLFTPQMSSKTSVRAFRSDRSKSKKFRKIKVPTHALRPKNAQIRKIDLGRTRKEKYLLSWKRF